MSRSLDAVVDALCGASARRTTRGAALPWPEARPQGAWFMSPELISLHGTPAYEGLCEASRKELSFWEAVNFFSVNIHGERRLVEGLAVRMYRPRAARYTRYLHHFVEEENDHMAYFGGFCMRYAGKVYPEKKVAFPREFEEGEEDVLFFGKVLVFEEVVDALNVLQAADARLVPIAREIHGLHHRDETRHLAFGRRLLGELASSWTHRWPAGTLAGVRSHLQDFLEATLDELANPDAYRDAGLPDPHRLREAARTGPVRRERLLRIAVPCVRFLTANGLLATRAAGFTPDARVGGHGGAAQHPPAQEGTAGLPHPSPGGEPCGSASLCSGVTPDARVGDQGGATQHPPAR